MKPMVELLICAMITVLPLYFYKRRIQGLRFETMREAVYELRWGGCICVTLTAIIIVAAFYYHPFSGDAEIVARNNSESGSSQIIVQATFNTRLQNFLSRGMIGEVLCDQHPMRVIPVVAVKVTRLPAETLRAELEPLYENGFKEFGIPGRCIANLYSIGEDSKGTTPSIASSMEFLVSHIAFVSAMTFRLRGITRAVLG